MVIFGLTSKNINIPAYILKNTLRWGYQGAIFGVTPGHAGEEVEGIRVHNCLEDLPVVPELAVMLIPARFIPSAMEDCGRLGVKRIAILAGGFNESGENGEDLARSITGVAAKYGIRFMGPNGLAVADAHSGICLPFVPHRKMGEGGFSFITQSGGLCLVLWNIMNDENVGMAKFASIGNKLNIDEADILEYLGTDPRTTVIGLYLESIGNGRRLVEAAKKINKPIIALKANVSAAGSRAAMSHTASMSNDDDIVNAAFEQAGIIRINHVHEFISMAKIFSLPPMRGNRLMVMTPGGGAAVIKADLCEQYGFEFADPGREFYEGLNQYTNAGVIRFSNPLDMGDIYNVRAYPEIFRNALSNENVDGAIYGHALPLFPDDDSSIFRQMFYTDITAETADVINSTGKPLGISMSSPQTSHVKICRKFDYPLFSRTEEMIKALRVQADFHARMARGEEKPAASRTDMDEKALNTWLHDHEGDLGEEILELLGLAGIPVMDSCVVRHEEEAARAASETGYPLVMKIVSPDVLHKSDAGGVVIDIRDEDAARKAFGDIRENVVSMCPDARIEGMRLMRMAEPGHDMFVGALRDESFGPVVVFGYGGIYTEVFRDIDRVLCPSSRKEIEGKLMKLKCTSILRGARGRGRSDIEAYIDIIQRVSHLMFLCDGLCELDLNPVRVFNSESGALVLDARGRIKGAKMTESISR
jgi:acetyltransferase